MWLVFYLSLFYFTMMQEVLAYRFGREPPHTNDFLRHQHRRLNDKPCTASISNDIDDCLTFKQGNKLAFSEEYDTQTSQESTSLDCSITSPENPSAETKLNTLEYWYAVEASENEIESWFKILEDKIYEIAFGKMSFCIMLGEKRLRRSLQRSRERELGILSVTSMPFDLDRSDVPCPSSIIREGLSCFVVQGRIRILARASVDLSPATAAMLEAIKNSMSPNTVLLGNDISTVTNVTYLGTTQSEVENWEYVPIGSTGNNQINAGTTDDDNSIFYILGAVMLLLLLLTLLLLCCLRRRQRCKDDDSHSADSSDIGESNTNKIHASRGVETNNGNSKGVKESRDHQQSYLSESSRKSTVTGSSSVSTDSDDLENIIRASSFVKANSKVLDIEHSGINVHKCASSTCKICMAGYKNLATVNFERFQADEVKLDEFRKESMLAGLVEKVERKSSRRKRREQSNQKE
mmetsp:Transcript_31190/g.34509  ORF Transcript_31190/g.34509 Transcript_31190/m.34509 type:complete len:464 (+) Transcript_31190:56-1447(+)